MNSSEDAARSLPVAESGTGAASDETYSVRALSRALQILLCFDVDHPEWSLGDLAKATNLNKTTVYRLLKTMEASRCLTTTGPSGQWQLGPGLMRLAYLASSQTQLATIARPHMTALAASTRETVDLTVWTGEGVLVVGQVLTSRPLRPVASVGRVFTDYANSHSKIFLAFMPEHKRTEALARLKPRSTPYTIVDPQMLRKELEKVAAEGVAYDLQERALGICGIAAPVRDFDGEVKASLGIIGPPERFGPSELERFVGLIREKADAVSRDLGFQPD